MKVYTMDGQVHEFPCGKKDWMPTYTHTYIDGLADGVAQVMDWYSEWSPEDAYPTFPDYVERRCERANIDCWWFRAETTGTEP